MWRMTGCSPSFSTYIFDRYLEETSSYSQKCQKWKSVTVSFVFYQKKNQKDEQKVVSWAYGKGIWWWGDGAFPSFNKISKNVTQAAGQAWSILVKPGQPIVIRNKSWWGAMTWARLRRVGFYQRGATSEKHRQAKSPTSEKHGQTVRHRSFPV